MLLFIKIQMLWKVQMCILLSWIPNKTLLWKQMALYKSDDSLQAKTASSEWYYQNDLWGGEEVAAAASNGEILGHGHELVFGSSYQ